MNDYSDLLFLIGAIAIYALLVTNTNRAMLQSNQMLTTTEMEYGAVSVAQNIIEKARWMKYDEISSSTEQNIENMNDNPEYEVEVEVSNIGKLSGSDKNNRRIDIKVTNKYMDRGNQQGSSVTMSYIKTDR